MIAPPSSTGDKIFPVAIGICLVLVIAGGVLLALFGAFDEPTRAKPAYHHGEIVEMKLDGRRGMVIYIRCWDDDCSYEVRFPVSHLATDTHVLAPDGPVTTGAYSDVWVRSFELRSAAQ